MGPVIGGRWLSFSEESVFIAGVNGKSLVYLNNFSLDVLIERVGRELRDD